MVIATGCIQAEEVENTTEQCLLQRMECNRLLEAEMETHRSAESTHRTTLQTLQRQCDGFQRVFSMMTRKTTDAEERRVLREKEMEDLTKLLQEKTQRCVEFQALCDLMKTERNRFVHHIHVGNAARTSHQWRRYG